MPRKGSGQEAIRGVTTMLENSYRGNTVNLAVKADHQVQGDHRVQVKRGDV